jgi:segregation and condensation protein A
LEAPIYHLEKVVKIRQTDMEDFNGPLDLILHLLSKNKIEIRDIQISDLLDQYMEWMERRKKLDLEVASEFVTMAAHLVYIKTRMLLSIDDEEAASEMELLMTALEEHQHHESYLKIKAVVEPLGARYEYGRDHLVKRPEPLRVDKTYQYAHDRGDLLTAMRGLLERTENQALPTTQAFEGIVGREPYPVADKAYAILERLIQFGVTRFRALFQKSRSRSEVVATFLAVLELCKANRIHLAGTAEDCTVTCTGEDSEEELNVTVDSY